MPLVNKKGDAAVYTVTATTAPSSRATEDLVNTLRNDVIAKSTKGKQMSAAVGGTTAGWWLPKWMERAIPKSSIEGNELFAEHETPAEQANMLQEEPEVHHEPGRTECSMPARIVWG